MANRQKQLGFRWADYAQGVRTGVRNNSTAYGFSVLITASFGALNALVGAPGIPQLFLFVAGAGLGFVLIEAAASHGFKDAIRGDRREVVVIGSAINLISISSALGAAVLVGYLWPWWVAWLAAPLLATVVYLGVNGLEMALARGAERRREGPS